MLKLMLSRYKMTNSVNIQADIRPHYLCIRRRCSMACPGIDPTLQRGDVGTY